MKYWPYTSHAIEETLDLELIEARGKQLLFQALNNRNLVAFLGSGTSQSYGRLSWNDWLVMQEGLIERFAGAFNKCAMASLELLTFLNEELKNTDGKYKVALQAFVEAKIREVAFHQQETRQLSKTFRDLKTEGDVLAGDKHPLVFEVAEQLQEMLLRNCLLFLPHDSDNSILNAAKIKGSGELNQKGASDHRIETTEDKIALVKIDFKFGYNSFNCSTPDPENRFRNWAQHTIVDNPNGNGSKDVHQKLRSFLEELVKFEAIAQTPGARLSVSDMAKTLLVDECSHAEKILRDSVEYSEETGRLPWSVYSKNLQNPPDKEQEEIGFILTGNARLRGMPSSTNMNNLKRDLDGIRRNPERYWSLGYFKTASCVGNI